MGFFDNIGRMAGELMADPQSLPRMPSLPRIDPSQAGELMMPGGLGGLGGIGRAIGGGISSIGRSVGGLLGGLGDLGPMAGELMAPGLPTGLLPSDFLPNIDPSVAGELMAPGLPTGLLPTDFLPNIDPSMLGELMMPFGG